MPAISVPGAPLGAGDVVASTRGASAGPAATSASPAPSGAGEPQVFGVVPNAGEGGATTVEIAGRLFRLEGAPTLMPGRPVTILVHGPPAGAQGPLGAALLTGAGDEPLPVTLVPELETAILPARPTAAIPGFLRIAGGTPSSLPLMVALAPPALDAQPTPAAVALSQLTRGEPVVLVPTHGEGTAFRLPMGAATLELPDPLGLVQGAPVQVRAAEPAAIRAALAMSGVDRPSRADPRRRGQAGEAARLPVDERLGAGLRALLADLAATRPELSPATEPRAVDEAGGRVGEDAGGVLTPIALLGERGAAAVLSVADEDTRPEADAGQRRLQLELHLPALGRVKLEVVTDGRRWSVGLATERRLTPPERAVILDLAGAACELDGAAGSLVFRRLAPAGPPRAA